MDATAAATLFAWLDREVWLVTARAGDRRGGLIATFVNPATIVPDLPRVLVSLARTHFTWELVQASGCFAVHLLSEENLELVWRFGLSSGRDRDKFDGLMVRDGPTGCPLLENTVGWMDCQVETRTEAGDRTIYLGEVVEAQVTRFAPPLTARRLLELAPAPMLSEMQRQRHQDSVQDAEAIRVWREKQA